MAFTLCICLKRFLHDQLASSNCYGGHESSACKLHLLYVIVFRKLFSFRRFIAAYVKNDASASCPLK